MKDRKQWKKGNGELIGFAVVALGLCSIIIVLTAFMQLSFGLNAITKAATAASRAAAICTSKEDAEKQVQLVAESAVTNPNVNAIETAVDYASNETEWGSGVFITVSVSAKVHTIEPLKTRRQTKKVLICIENKKSSEALEVCKNIIYAVETGGQVYGNCNYSAFTPAGGNVSAEKYCTIGAGQWYGPQAIALLQYIKANEPQMFDRLDTKQIRKAVDSNDLDYINVSPGSPIADCIVSILSSEEGKRCQDSFMRQLIGEYFAEAEALGVTDDGAKIEYANARYQGGEATARSVVANAARPYTAETLYASIMSRSGPNQIGSYRSRQTKVYQWIQQYLQ